MAIAQQVMGFALVEFKEIHDIAQAVAGQSFAPKAFVLKGQGQGRTVFAEVRALMPRCIFDPCQKRDRAVMFLKDVARCCSRACRTVLRTVGRERSSGREKVLSIATYVILLFSIPARHADAAKVNIGAVKRFRDAVRHTRTIAKAFAFPEMALSGRCNHLDLDMRAARQRRNSNGRPRRVWSLEESLINLVHGGEIVHIP